MDKGTIGMIVPEKDMPVTLSGIVPDVIINPHAIPSRMTVGQLMESVLGKSSVFDAKFADATPFVRVDSASIGDALESHGLDRKRKRSHDLRYHRENDAVRDVRGSYYQRLKHMTTDKCHSRTANGPVTALVRQPAEGRARDGGLRLGEMEVDCLFGHGAMHFLKERLYDCSDAFKINICDICGRMAIVNPAKIYTSAMPAVTPRSFQS